MINSKLFGSILIFSGTCIGAGMLALPLSTSGAGFIISILLLVLSAITSIATALLILEVLSKTPKSIVNFNSMSRYALGKPGQWFCLISYLSLLFSISCAFVSGGTSMIDATLGQFHINIPHHYLNFLYITCSALIVFLGHGAVDCFNRFLFSIKGISFILLVGFLFPHVNTPTLFDIKGASPYILSAIPVLFFSFGLQVVVPSVYIYQNNDTQMTKKSIILGCLLPFAMYLIWLTITLGVLPRFGLHSYSDFLSQYSNNDIGQFLLYINQEDQWSTYLINIFANVAIATSFITASLGLKDFIIDITNSPKGLKGNILSTFLTFMPTYILISLLPNIFQTALNFSAALITFSLIFLPIAMVISIRLKNKTYMHTYTLKGGYISLFALTLVGCILFLVGILASLQKLPVLSS